MFDLSAELNEFYEKHVRLGKTRRDELAAFRDNCLKSLRSGIDKLNAERSTNYPYWREYRNQGGYKMGTLNQAADNNYDIDVALIFDKDGLPSGAKAARERIRDAFKKTSGRFKEEPNARKNAVTVWYAEGQHLDFAIYRTFVDDFGRTRLEHAGGEEWNHRDPDEIAAWFDAAVEVQSPSTLLNAVVAKDQLRRIVRFAKYFNKSRSIWRHPGGLITSILVSECYCPNDHRDDLALVDTLDKLYYRLQRTVHVHNPVDQRLLTSADKRVAEVVALRDRLSEVLPKLAILRQSSCSREQARNAWRQFFNHEFWNAENDKASSGGLLRKMTAAPATAFGFPDARRAPTTPQGFA